MTAMGRNGPKPPIGVGGKQALGVQRFSTRWTLLAAVSSACILAAPAPPSPIATAEAFIDAFYSFDRARLDAAMANASESKPDILYYQGWAEGGHYVILKRKPCQIDKVDEVSCAVTVKDEFVPVLGTGYDVTDVFHIAFRDGRIVKVWNSSNDPPEFKQAMVWLERERPEIFTGPCLGIWQGGPTPQDCVRAVTNGMKEWAKSRR